jgi:hypothetical protein
MYTLKANASEVREVTNVNTRPQVHVTNVLLQSDAGVAERSRLQWAETGQ